MIAHVIFRCRWIGHDDDFGRQPGISLEDQLGRTLESCQNMCTRRDWQLPEPADVLAGYDEQTIEIRPTDHDRILVEVHGDIGVLAVLHVAGNRLRKCATLGIAV